MEMLEQLSAELPAEKMSGLDMAHLLTSSRSSIVIRLFMFAYRAQLVFIYRLRSGWQALGLHLFQRHKLRRPLTCETIPTPDDACPDVLLF